MPAQTLPAAYRSPRELLRLPEGSPVPRVLLGLSGGADSVVLLDMLLSDGIPVAAAHLHHGIRGEEADRDARFCRELCEARGVPLFYERADIPAVCAETGEGTEEAARRIRYAFFAEIMKNEQISVLITAHNADDQAETVLLHLTRGASPKGVCGIAPRREVPEGILLRPLLQMPKTEILAYCKSRSLSYVTDSTNGDIAYARNRIRAKVLPELEAINPGFLSAVAAFTEAARADCAYLDGEAAAFLADHPRFNGKALAKLPVPIASRVLTVALREHGANPEHGHVAALLAGAREGRRVTVTVPGGIIATLPPRKNAFFVKDERKKKNNVNGDMN